MTNEAKPVAYRQALTVQKSTVRDEIYARSSDEYPT